MFGLWYRSEPTLMLLFDNYFVEPILESRKTVTRRGWERCLVKAGSTQTLMCYYSRFGVFGKAKVESVQRQKLSEMREEDARREGFDCLEEFKTYWQRFGPWKEEQEVWVIAFRFIDESKEVVVRNLLSLFSLFGV